MRSLASGEKGYEKFPKLFRDKFVFLNVYCRSVADEHNSRGPEGPYRFKDRSVPVLLFKRWDGETIHQQLGFAPDKTQAARRLAQMVDKALKDHGPIQAPKALRPLIQSMEKAEGFLTKRKSAAAIKELQKVIKLGADEKTFPEEVPLVAQRAGSLLSELEQRGLKAVKKIVAEEARPGNALRALRNLGREYAGIDSVKLAVQEATAHFKDH